jgi:thioredoxin reductase
MKLPLELGHLSKYYSRNYSARISQHYRTLATVTSTPTVYDAVVIGAGPGGLTCASNLLDQGLSKICIVDPSFTAGRINEKYREVPSNTKTGMFAQWATGTKAFSRIVESTPKPNAYERLLSFDQDKGCVLGDAVDVAKLLSDGLRRDPRVDSVVGRVEAVSKDRNLWNLAVHGIKAERVVLAHGSHPKPHDLADQYPHLTALDLDACLKPSALRSAVPAGSKVGVIGASHSAVLALKNLHEIENVSIVNFHRSPLLYAIYKDGWILYDNTGLKGIAADWAREVLAAKDLPPRLRRVDLRADGRQEKQIYDAELKDCTHLVSAIGYEMNSLPKIQVDGSEVEPEFDPLTGKFFCVKGGQEYLDGLFGAGIAYPERVTDRIGNVESAVGWFKFMKFVKRVVPDWLEQGK